MIFPVKYRIEIGSDWAEVSNGMELDRMVGEQIKRGVKPESIKVTVIELAE